MPRGLHARRCHAFLVLFAVHETHRIFLSHFISKDVFLHSVQLLQPYVAIGDTLALSLVVSSLKSVCCDFCPPVDYIISQSKDDKPPLKGRGQCRVTIFQFRRPQSYLRNGWSDSRQILYAGRVCQVLGFWWQTTLMGVVRVTWPVFYFYPNHICGIGVARHFIFRVLIDI